jgi:hypothetical protein
MCHPHGAHGAFTRRVNQDSTNQTVEEGMMGEFSQILTGCTERVTCGKLPHASKELGKTAIEKGHANYDIRNCNAACANVEKGED